MEEQHPFTDNPYDPNDISRLMVHLIQGVPDDQPLAIDLDDNGEFHGIDWERKGTEPIEPNPAIQEFKKDIRRHLPKVNANKHYLDIDNEKQKTLFDDYAENAGQQEYLYDLKDWINKENIPETNRKKAKRLHEEKKKENEEAEIDAIATHLIVRFDALEQERNQMNKILSGEEDTPDIDTLSKIFDIDDADTYGDLDLADIRKSLIQVYGYKTKEQRALNSEIKNYVHKLIDEKTELINERRVRLSAGPKNYKRKKINSIDEKIRKTEAVLDILKAKCPELVPELVPYDFKEVVPINEELKAKKDAARDERYKKQFYSEMRECINIYHKLGAKMLVIDPPKARVIVPNADKINKGGIPIITGNGIKKTIDNKAAIEKMKKIRKSYQKYIRDNMEEETTNDDSNKMNNFKNKMNSFKNKAGEFAEDHVKEIVAGCVMGILSFGAMFVKSA